VKNKSGFTLIEVILTLVVLGIIMITVVETAVIWTVALHFIRKFW
jgi:prepilin-type N-terminal cleavage/methylation domain-containing protein